VFNAYEEEDREVDPVKDSYGGLRLAIDKKKQPAKAKGSKTRGKKGKNALPVPDVDPAHVKGSFDTCDIGSAFAGLEDDGDCAWTFKSDSLTKEEDEDQSEDNDFEYSQFRISVLDVVDDKGNPFVEFAHSPGSHEMIVTYIGKKQKLNRAGEVAKMEGLTEGERKRLGIFVEEDEIKRAALELKGIKVGVHIDGEEDIEDGGPASGDLLPTAVALGKRKAEEIDGNEEEGPAAKK
jgi:hypothetical protein